MFHPNGFTFYIVSPLFALLRLVNRKNLCPQSVNFPLDTDSVIFGWRGRIDLGFTPGSEKTLLAKRARTGPVSVQRPFHPEDELCHVYFLHPPGGVVGGDELEYNVEVDSGAKALITSPGTTKFYRSAGAMARVKIDLFVEGSLEWLPQASILFRGAKIRLNNHIKRHRQRVLLAGKHIAWAGPRVAKDLTKAVQKSGYE